MDCERSQLSVDSKRNIDFNNHENEKPITCRKIYYILSYLRHILIYLHGHVAVCLSINGTFVEGHDILKITILKCYLLFVVPYTTLNVSSK